MDQYSSSAMTTDDLRREVARRRAFAIISHPDAGKTTLTEKLLLYAGAVELAGAVRRRGHQRHATSDWMSMEQARGISISASALEAEYRGCHINLLDTPGHEDFSEDTYRTLIAVDSAVMVLDSAKGVEARTEKLFQVCRRRGIPVVTFINKMDRLGREPLELLDEIERVLGIAAVPWNWPIGAGPTFQGVYDLSSDRILRFERREHGSRRSPVLAGDLNDRALAERLGATAYRELREHVELLAGAGATFDHTKFLTGKLTPVFFGSALTNFGVEPFFDALLELAPAPQARLSDQGPVEPTQEAFSGFIFKIQANMDPRHRDRLAFLRVCSGRFQRNMVTHHSRLGRKVRLTQAYRLFARERESLEEAFPGDVIGLISPGLFTIGDTLSAGPPLRFAAIPRFPPELFGVLRNRDMVRYKSFAKGLAQLEEEGAIQVLWAADQRLHAPILAAIGELQFEVVVARLGEEYGVDASVERLPFTQARWIDGDPEVIDRMTWPTRGTLRCHDREGRLVVLFASMWELEYSAKHNPDVHFLEGQSS
jgi:peptide chain release factor 3